MGDPILTDPKSDYNYFVMTGRNLRVGIDPIRCYSVQAWCSEKQNKMEVYVYGKV